MAEENFIVKSQAYKVINGEKILTEEIHERFSPAKGLERKDKIDLAFRLIGLLALAIPLYLFYQQREAEVQRTSDQYELATISKTISGLYTLNRTPGANPEFDNNMSQVFYEYRSQMKVAGEKSIKNHLDSLEMQFGILKTLETYCAATDSLAEFAIFLGSYKLQDAKKFEERTRADIFSNAAMGDFGLKILVDYSDIETLEEELTDRFKILNKYIDKRPELNKTIEDTEFDDSELQPFKSGDATSNIVLEIFFFKDQNYKILDDFFGGEPNEAYKDDKGFISAARVRLYRMRRAHKRILSNFRKVIADKIDITVAEIKNTNRYLNSRHS